MGKNRPKMFCILSAKKYTRLYKAVGVMTNMLFYMGYWYFHVDELKFVAGEDIHGFPRVISSMTEATYFTKHGGRHNRRRHRVLKLYQENMYQHKLRPHHQHSNCEKITKKYFRRSLFKRGARARVAGLGKLSAGAKMAMKPFVKRVFTIFATNASFLRVISNFRI